MIFSFIERRIHKARLRREARENYLALKSDTANHCEGCEGEGEVVVHGVGSSTGMEMCYECGGMGIKPELLNPRSKV